MNKIPEELEEDYELGFSPKMDTRKRKRLQEEFDIVERGGEGRHVGTGIVGKKKGQVKGAKTKLEREKKETIPKSRKERVKKMLATREKKKQERIEGYTDCLDEEINPIGKSNEWCKNKLNYVRWVKERFKPIIDKSKAEYDVPIPYNFVPRWYQMQTVEAMLTYRFVIFCMHRRSGKDYMSISMLLLKAMERVGNYYYLFPKAKQGRKILWEGLDNDGKRFRDHIHTSLVKVNKRSNEKMINNTEMMITLVNGSTIQIVGSDNYDTTIVGTNVAGVIFSEYALSDPMSWNYCRPILAANRGWAWINSTPRGKNHFHLMLMNAMQSELLVDVWHGAIVKNSETGVVSQEELEVMEAEGMSKQMLAQEMECSFEGVVEGVIYSLQVIDAKKEGRFGSYMFDSKLPVYIGFDIGVDMIAMTFFQVRGDRPFVIDFYGAKGMGVNHVARIARDYNKRYGYKYETIFLPHDGKNRNINNYDDEGYALTTKDTFRKEFSFCDIEVIDRAVDVNEDIEVVRGLFYRWYFNTEEYGEKTIRERLDYFYDAMYNYTYPRTSRDKNTASKPIHNWASHPMDSFRTAVHAVALGLCSSKAKTWLSDLDYERSGREVEDFNESDLI